MSLSEKINDVLTRAEDTVKNNPDFKTLLITIDPADYQEMEDYANESETELEYVKNNKCFRLVVRSLIYSSTIAIYVWSKPMDVKIRQVVEWNVSRVINAATDEGYDPPFAEYVKAMGVE